jgi:plastocyanin
VTAQHLAFSADCLAAPAGKPFTVVLATKDPVSTGGASPPNHNVGIYTEPSFENEVFAGAVVPPQKTATYHVPPLGRGIYSFRCDIHPFMKGTFVID